MIPDPLIPLFTALRLQGIPACIAGGYAACPEKAEDIDVWITVNGNNTIADMLHGMLDSLRATWSTVHPENLCWAKTEKFNIPGLHLPVEVMLTRFPPEELIEKFDITTHAIAITPAATFKASCWTPTTKLPEYNERAVPGGYHGPEPAVTSRDRMKKIKERYGMQTGWDKFKKIVPFAMVLLSLAVPASAQGPIAAAAANGPAIVAYLDALTPAPDNPTVRKVADVASYGTWGAALALDAWNTPRNLRSYSKLGARLGAVGVTAFAIKQAVHRERPCSPDCAPDKPDTSFISGHTAYACSAIDWHGDHKAAGVALAVATAAGRIIGKKHWLTDTLGGCGVGLVYGRLIR